MRLRGGMMAQQSIGFRVPTVLKCRLPHHCVREMQTLDMDLDPLFTGRNKGPASLISSLEGSQR